MTSQRDYYVLVYISLLRTTPTWVVAMAIENPQFDPFVREINCINVNCLLLLLNPFVFILSQKSNMKDHQSHSR